MQLDIYPNNKQYGENTKTAQLLWDSASSKPPMWHGFNKWHHSHF